MTNPQWTSVDDDTADLPRPNAYTFRRGAEPTISALLAATITDARGCFVWQRSTDGKGYGQVSIRGKRWMIHRLAWTLTRGPIPDGLTVDHMCFNTRCINPAHLRLLTVGDNAANSRRALSDYCKRGHEFTAENTLILRSRGGDSVRRHCRTCKRKSNREGARRRRARKDSK